MVIACQGGQVVNPVPGVGETSPCSVMPAREQSPIPRARVASPNFASLGVKQVSPGPTVMHTSRPVGEELDLDADHDVGVPLRFRTLQNIDLVGPVLRHVQ
jgi:hypothetical protein